MNNLKALKTVDGILEESQKQNLLMTILHMMIYDQVIICVNSKIRLIGFQS